MQLIGFNGSDVSWDSPALEQSSLDGNGFYDRSLTAVLNFDAAVLESILDRAAVHLTKPELIGTVIVPLCQKIGELWKKGKLKVINEHMATTVIQAFLWNLLRTAESAQTSPKIVVATPAGHQHELGALAIALIACESGWRSLYFGPSLPAEEIAAAAALANARAVALSITYCNDDHQLNLEVKKLQRYLGGDITLFVGGQAAAASVDFVDLPGMQIVEDVGTFRIALDTLRVTRHG